MRKREIIILKLRLENILALFGDEPPLVVELLYRGNAFSEIARATPLRSDNSASGLVDEAVAMRVFH